MIRTQCLGMGSFVPERIITNDELRYLNPEHVRCDEIQMETTDEWIQTRTGIKKRHYADVGVSCTDLALEASKLAIEDAGIKADDIECIIYATLSPDVHFPGSGVVLQQKLGIHGGGCPSFDIRQQCSGFVYGLQMADAFIKTGLYKTVLLVGAELHSHSLDFTTRGRDVSVIFGDGAGAMLFGAQETEDESAGVVYTKVYSDGSGARDLHMDIFHIDKRPYLTYDPKNRDENQIMYPHMNGKKVFLNAVRAMVMSTQQALADTKLTWDDIDWFVPHQANLRINQKVAEVAAIPDEKILNTIEFYGNTTAATVPLTIDYWKKQGKVKKGDKILAAVFGSGFTWGAAVFHA